MNQMLASEREAPVLNGRVSTGNPQADSVLCGGFPVNSINIIMGQPGTGKTIFAEQLLFHNADRERPVLYLTTLSEPFQKVVSYLQRFSFFDAAKFGSSVVYDDVGFELIERGVDALHERVRLALREQQPRIIVIDSFKAVHDLTESTQMARRWLVDLAGELGASDTTTFLVGEYTSQEIALYPEFAVADGIVEFARKPLSTRDERYMRVLKLRGSSYQEGSHGLRIGSDGVEVFPRLVGAHRVQPVFPAGRVSSGIGGIDVMLDGGLWHGSSTLVVGAAGTGKTTTALQFLIDGVRRGEPGIFVNFQESPAQVTRFIGSLGLNQDELAARGLHLMYFSPVELHIDSIIASLFETISRFGIKRLALDAVGDLITGSSDSDRLHDYLYALMQHLTAYGVTSLFTLETMDEGEAITTGLRISYMSDNIVWLRLCVTESRPTRLLRIMKARATAHDLAAHEFTIGSDGITVQ